MLATEDTALTITEAQLLEYATDVDGDDLHVENLRVREGFEHDGTLIDNGDDTWTFVRQVTLVSPSPLPMTYLMERTRRRPTRRFRWMRLMMLRRLVETARKCNGRP